MKFINHVKPVDPRKATGTVAEIYAEAGRDFGRLPEPVMMWSPHEGLLAAGWAVLRETLLAGEVPRARKETIAASVSAGLRCPWCVDAHTTMLYATGDAGTAAAILANDDPVGENAPLVAWARGTAAPSGPPPPFGRPEAAECIGTAMAFHFTARMVLVLLDETFLPGGPRTQSLLRRAAGRALARTARRTHPPGLSVQRLPQSPLPADLAWAAANPPIARAFAAMTDCLDNADHLAEPSRAAVQHALQAWHGEPKPLSSSWTAEYTDHLPEELRPSTRLALLTSLAPHQVTDADVAAARQLLTTDEALVAALAWAAWSTARRIGSWTTQPVDAPTIGTVSVDNTPPCV
ncbi:MAG: carboxymuconolactone decarboxylase family protein [Actinomycetota bacterium]|jgi:AhpD family alkylhydroperoxidase|nr:carboxymuconolactone decarboxylase family protein [Actinomycetota bacterium]MDA2949331.1 carboxymuconolactone decarboxylase family protein [Actinomycetota bacterium]